MKPLLNNCTKQPKIKAIDDYNILGYALQDKVRLNLRVVSKEELQANRNHAYKLLIP